MYKVENSNSLILFVSFIYLTESMWLKVGYKLINAREARGKNLVRGGTKVRMVGDSEFWGWGGTGLDGGGTTPGWGGVPPIPPHS